MNNLSSLEGKQVDVIADGNRILAMSAQAIGKVRQVETRTRDLPQVPIRTNHVIHAGIYSRTIMVPAGVFITGAEIKRSTMLNICGRVIVYIDGKAAEFTGAHLLACSPGRKQAFLAIDDTHLTMSFATKARTIAEAEAEFTDEAELLISRHQPELNQTIITGE